MLIKVLSVKVQATTLIECETAAGPLTARWRGKHSPRTNEVHDVELDTVGDLNWGETVHVADGVPRLQGAHLLVGLVEDVDGDAVTLRVAGSVVLLDVSGQPPLGVIGRMASVRPSGFAVWPTGT